AIPVLMSVIEVVGWTLLHFIWQGAAVAVLTGSLLIALRRSSPHARYVSQCGLFGILTLCPLITGFVLAQHGIRRWEIPQSISVSHSHPIDSLMTPESESQDFSAHSIPLDSTSGLTVPSERIDLASGRWMKLWPRVSETMGPFMPWLVLAWFTGVAVLS